VSCKGQKKSSSKKTVCYRCGASVLKIKRHKLSCKKILLENGQGDQDSISSEDAEKYETGSDSDGDVNLDAGDDKDTGFAVL
jgi:hypothetical protein